MTKKTLLIEIGTEELPSRLLSTISFHFYQNLIKELKFNNILYENIQYFSTPRRLALKIIDIDTADKIIEKNKKGPSIIDAYDQNGLPTEIANRWARYCKINLDQADRIKTKKGEWLFYREKIKKDNIEILIPKITEIALKKIIIPKSMRWEYRNEKFSRPIRNIVIMLDSKIIKGKIFNINSNNLLQNHLSEKEKKIKIKHSEDYPLILLQKNNIIANYEIRKQTIIKQINSIAKTINGFIKSDNVLIEEVTSLVESPKAFLANFNKKFLKIPTEIVVYTIENKQKCFPIYNSKKEILPFFIFISNINPKEPEIIIKGNEKVMHARLSDAEFFFKNDREIKLEDYLLSLKNVLFQNNLGTLYEKTFRIKSLIIWISKYNFSNIDNSIRAALLSKCDLVTNMVCEFPELQGIVGMYYALKDQEKQDVAIALKEQYLPSFSGDKIPSSSIGCALSIADKMDTLSGMFYIGNNPSSDKDPFALRRLAIGILRIIIMQKIPLDLKDLVNKSLSLYKNKNIDCSKLHKKIINFLLIRLFYWYKELGYDIKIIKSILSYELTQPIDIDKRIKAISFFKKLENSDLIILSIKRISNILEQEDKNITEYVNPLLFKKIEETTLFNEIEKFNNYTKELLKKKKYKKVLLNIQNLEKPINNFFNTIRIHHSNPIIRFNRLSILYKLKNVLFKIANFSCLY